MADQTHPFSVEPLHEGFVIAKPIQSAPDQVFLELEAKGLLRTQRKHNGHGSFVTNGGRLYSRTVRDLTEHFPAVAAEIRELDLPHDTLLVSETLVERDGIETLEAFGALANAKPENAVRAQLESGIDVQLRIFNIAVHKGKPVLDLPYDDRQGILHELTHRHRSRNVCMVPNLPYSFEAAKARSLESKWEGLVLYDGSAASAYRLDGKVDRVPRPLGCWKWKQYREEDFVATGFVLSDATTRGGMVRDLTIAQYHPLTGELVDCGRTSSGLSLTQRKELANEALYPFVVEIEYERRTPSWKLINAEIRRMRDDKTPHECLLPLS